MSSGFSKYDRNNTNQSIYCYEGTDVLKNKLNIRNAEALASYEADITLQRQYELIKQDAIKGKFTVTHLKAIHRYIFQDVYKFAGKFRLEDISKESTTFCKSQFIEENLRKIFKDLRQERYLKDLHIEEFSNKIAYYMSEINMVHPFREGNGRAIRELIRQLAEHNGFTIDWSQINGNTLLDATIAAVSKDYDPLSACIRQTIVS